MHTSHSIFTDKTDLATVKFSVYLGSGVCLCEIQTRSQTPSQQPGTLPGGSGPCCSPWEGTGHSFTSQLSGLGNTGLAGCHCGEFCVLVPGHRWWLLLQRRDGSYLLHTLSTRSGSAARNQVSSLLSLEVPASSTLLA